MRSRALPETSGRRNPGPERELAPTAGSSAVAPGGLQVRRWSVKPESVRLVRPMMKSFRWRFLSLRVHQLTVTRPHLVRDRRVVSASLLGGSPHARLVNASASTKFGNE